MNAPTLLIARFTFREAMRKQMVLAVILLSAVLVGLYWYGFSSMRSNYDSRLAMGELPPFEFPVFANALVLMGFYTVNFLSGVMAICIGRAIAAEVDAGTLHTILPKPIRRSEVVLGKWLGHALMLTVYVMLMCGSVLLVSYYVGDYLPPNPLQGSALVVLVSLVLLSLTILGSTFFSSLTNGIVVFMLYGTALMGGVVEQIGDVLERHADQHRRRRRPTDTKRHAVAADLVPVAARILPAARATRSLPPRRRARR
ncbi:MAG: ABC transporter permease [Chloroflexia bacterium]